MKFKSKLNTNEFKIKLIISTALLMLLVLSFFFAENIELALGFKSSNAAHLSDYESVADSEFFVEYLDVGQGSCTYISLPDGKNILVDGGSTMYSSTVEEFLKSRGVTTLDYIIATHADADHIGTLSYILGKFEVKKVLRPFQIAGTGTSAETFEVYEDEDLAEVYQLICSEQGERNKVSRVTTKIYKQFISGIYSETYTEFGVEKSCEVTVFYDGLKISGTNYELEFFAPFVMDGNIELDKLSNTGGYATIGYGIDDSNNSSAIFVLSVLGNSFLFTGDAPFCDNSKSGDGFEEHDFVKSLTSSEREKLSHISVYLAGHHGSKFSSGETLLSLIRPRFVVISVSENNNYGHPNPEALERLEKYKAERDIILRTDRQGTITFAMSSGKLVFVCAVQTGIFTTDVSWILVSVIVFVFVEIIIISIKPGRKQKPNLLT